MARHKKHRKGGFKKFYKHHRTGINLMGSAMGAMLYGAGREKLSNMLAPVTAKVPLGVVSDEAVMIGVNYALATGKIPVLNNIPITREIGKAGLMIEFARVGESIADGSLIASLKGGQPAAGNTQGLLF